MANEAPPLSYGVVIISAVTIQFFLHTSNSSLFASLTAIAQCISEQNQKNNKT